MFRTASTRTTFFKIAAACTISIGTVYIGNRIYKTRRINYVTRTAMNSYNSFYYLSDYKPIQQKFIELDKLSKSSLTSYQKETINNFIFQNLRTIVLDKNLSDILIESSGPCIKDIDGHFVRYILSDKIDLPSFKKRYFIENLIDKIIDENPKDNKKISIKTIRQILSEQTGFDTKISRELMEKIDQLNQVETVNKRHYPKPLST